MDASESRVRRYVSKCAVAVVMKELATIGAGYEQILVPIIVVVGDRHPDAIPRSGHARLSGYIGKGPVAVIAIQTVVEPGVRLVHLGQVGTVCEVEIKQPVIVVVEHPHAARHGFRLVFLGLSAVIQNELDARGPDDILKRDRRLRTGGERVERELGSSGSANAESRHGLQELSAISAAG